jgi:polypeptide-transport-associated domain protein, ftsQ-type
MAKDNSTQPELNKEEYLKSLFNDAKEELEAYIEFNDESNSATQDVDSSVSNEDLNSISDENLDSESGVDLNTDKDSSLNETEDEVDSEYESGEENLDKNNEVSESSEADEFELEDDKSEEASGSQDKENSHKTIDKEELDDIEKRRLKRRRKLKMPGFFTRVFIVVGITIAVIAFSLSNFFTVDTIDVQGNKYFTDEEISNMAHASTGRNIIYKLNKGSMRKYLEKNPYIEEARVYRKLPSTIVINVKERMQIATLTYGDKFLIIDNKGTLLRITKTKPKLTIVTGFKVKKVKLGEAVEVSNPDLFKELLSLLKSMEEGDVYFTKINITEMFITANVYDSLVVRSKYKDLKENIDKGRLHKVLDELFKRNIKRGTITISSDGYASFTPEL